jgi:hypothetical protein
VSIVRNEAQRLPRLLASLEEFRRRGGEVLLLDTGSTDDTVRLGREAGCRVFVEPHRFESRLSRVQAKRIQAAFSRGGEGPFLNPGDRLFDVAKARAHAASLARHAFQLAVDGCDVVDAMDVSFLDATARSRRVATLRFENRVLCRHGWLLGIRDFFYDRRLVEWRGRSHSFLAPRSFRSESKPSLLPPDQLHVSHHTDFDRSRVRQLAGTALDALADPGADRWRHYLGRDLAARGYHRSALPIVLALDRPGAPPAARSYALCLAADCVSGFNGEGEEVETLLFRAAQRDSNSREPLLRLAARGLSKGDMQGAASFASAALAIPRRPGVAEPEANYSARPHAILYWALLWLGSREAARPHFEICRKLDPANPLYVAHARFFAEDAA